MNSVSMSSSTWETQRFDGWYTLAHRSRGVAEFGNARGNENVFTVAEVITWFRYHNYLASQLQQKYPSRSDEELFQNARKKVIATLQVQTASPHFH
ncbi:dual oxidase 1-like isoform X1 [Arapaima gigas]